ncbi:MAG: enoyl-CoA hydratase [Pseudomonadota bacterium]
MSESPVLHHTDNGVLRLTLNTPASRNSLSLAMLDALQAALDSAQDHPAVRVVVIAANGPVFCAGHDLKEMTAARQNSDRGRAFFEDTLARCATLMQSLTQLPQPVIAEVHAMATAAGCQLAASADLVVASDTAQFATPGVHIGLFCSTPMVALSRAVGAKHAMEMLLLGDPVDAETAHRMGLVNRVVPVAELRATVDALAAKIASKSTLTVKTGKRAFYRQRELDLAAAYDYASAVMTENMLAHDAEEGIGAFIEKRDPDWQDR